MDHSGFCQENSDIKIQPCKDNLATLNRRDGQGREKTTAGTLCAQRENSPPGGDRTTRNCTACARIVTDRFGGKVEGCRHCENPTARVGKTEYGHDFAKTDDRFLVDAWLFHYYGETPVLELMEAAGQAEAAVRYGPEDNRKPVPSQEVKVKEARSPDGRAL